MLLLQVHATIVTSCHGNDDEAWSTSNVSLQKLLSLHKSMQVGVGVQSYKTDDRDREYIV